MPRYIDPVPQYLLTDGDPSPAGKLYFFESGTNTPLTTYADVNETIANPHPVILSGDGSTPNIFFSEAAKVKRTDSDDVQLWERDPVVTATTTSALGGTWDAITVYNIGDIAEVNDVLYVSITNNNQNNNPVTEATDWTEFDLLKRWNVNETYKVGDPVTGSDGLVYVSAINSNTGTDPTTSNDSVWKTNRPNAKNLLLGNFRVNTRSVSGTVVLAAGEYGHDRFRGGSSGCTYTFSTTANVTTVTITAGTLEQVVEGDSISSGTHVLSWTGTAQGQIDGGGFADSGVTATLTGGTDAVIEFDDGTISLPLLQEGSVSTSYDLNDIGDVKREVGRYTFRLDPGDGSNQGHIGTGNWINATQAIIYVPFPQELRVAPSLIIEGTIATDYGIYASGDLTIGPLSAIAIEDITTTYAALLVTFLIGSQVAGVGTSIFTFDANTTNSLIFDAEI